MTVPITPGSGANIASDLIADVHFQEIKIMHGAEGAAVAVTEADPLPVKLPADILAAIEANQPPSTQAVSGPVTNAELRASAVPVSLATAPLPSGAATSAGVALVGTRSYGAGATRLALGTSNVASSAITASEVLLHASAKCFVRVNTAATVNDIPLEAGEKFHLRITSGNTINVIQETAVAGFLNIVPVA